MSTFISVVIPTYRRPQLLRRCLDALDKQRFPKDSFEVIIVSDGKDTETANLIQESGRFYRDLQIRYFELPEKKGPAAARNFGWKHAEGELIAFTDDDCIPSPQWLEQYWAAFRAQEKIIISFTGKVVVPVPEFPTDYQKNVSHLETADFITANCACSQATLIFVHGFDEAFPIAWREDSAFEFDLLEHNVQIIKIEKAEVTHPVRDAHWGVSIQDQKKSMFNALLFKKHPDFYRKKISSHPVWNYYAIIFFSLLGVMLYVFGNKTMALISLVIWLLMVGKFIYNRLNGTNMSVSHRLEMIVTSFLIPYLSVYWTIRGAIRYKVFFL